MQSGQIQRLSNGQREEENVRMSGSHHIIKLKDGAVIATEQNSACYGVLHFPVAYRPMSDLWYFSTARKKKKTEFKMSGTYDAGGVKLE